jgi:hypothetical protein
MTLCSLPAPIPQIAEALGFRAISDTLQQIPPTATWLLPLISVAVLAGYASYLQWWDERNYKAVFDNWDKLARTHGFRNLSEIAIRWMPKEIRPIVEIARKRGEFVIPFNSVDVSFEKGLSALLELDKNGESDFVMTRQSQFLIHPDLLKQSQK